MALVHWRILVMQFCFTVGAILILIVLGSATTAMASQALFGCTDHCGNLTIPYPFGIGDGCYLEGQDQFSITCDQSTQPPSANWTGSNITITNFNLEEGELQIMQDLARDCYDDQGIGRDDGYLPSLQLPPPYTLSDTKNKFFEIGCDSAAIFLGDRAHPGPDENTTVAGYAMTLCDDILGKEFTNSCSGFGCSQTPIPSGLRNFSVDELGSVVDNRTGSEWYTKYPCSYAFVVELAMFTFSPHTSFDVLATTRKLPAVVNWAFGNETCEEQSPNFACKYPNTNCVNRIITSGPSGYICQCSQGYRGNPYLPDGCEDINECEASFDPCKNGMCINEPVGSYSCKCDNGYRNENGNLTTCNPYSKANTTSLKVSLGVIIGFFILGVLISWIYCVMNKRRLIKLKEKHFKENGGLRLLQQLATNGGGVETTKIFTAEELKKATNNYHADEILGKGGFGTVYKGTLHDNNVVAIKKSNNGASTQGDQFVNEVIVLSQINHRNIVKLLGCCLETEIPSLVYEYLTHGTLFDHIFKKGKGSSLSWELRLKIASETAGALAYLHSSASIPIIHRDVKTMNILLDDNYTAKVSDFGASRFIPLDQTQLATLVQGTLGYLDPEYFHTNQLTEKSDVYSFGVVLAELLTSRVALSYDRPDAERCLASFFVSSIEKECLIQILDADIVNEGNIETVEQVANMAKRCLRMNSEERPTMKEVALELEGMRIMAKHPWKNGDSCPEETEYLLGSPNSVAYTVDIGGEGDGGSSATNTGYDSMQIQMLMPYDDGR